MGTVNTGLEISTRPLAQASVKTTWASTNPRLFVAFIKGTRPMASAVKIKFPSLLTAKKIQQASWRFKHISDNIMS